MSHEDDLARMRAVFDQAREGLAEMAGMMVTYYRSLVEAGMDPDQAILLTVSCQQTLMTNAGDDDAAS